MSKTMTRKQFFATSSRWVGGAAVLLSVPGLTACSNEATETPVDEPAVRAVSRIKMTTIGATDLTQVEDWYGNWLDHTVAERGEISKTLADSWGTPNMAGRPYILMQPESGTDVFIRAALIDGVAGYNPMTTFGWNSFEIIVDDVYALNERLQDSPFDIIGAPESLGGEFASIHAMQVIGPMQEVLYLTCETGDRETSILPPPESFVDRVFIVVLAGPDTSVIQQFYSSKLRMEAAGEFDTPIERIAGALGLPEDHIFHLKMVTATERGNLIEIDDYPASAGPRPHGEGQLPPGNAMTSFSSNSLDQLDVDFISSPVQETSLAYGGHRSAALIGPAGEIIEIIEEPR